MIILEGFIDLGDKITLVKVSDDDAKS